MSGLGGVGSTVGDYYKNIYTLGLFSGGSKNNGIPGAPQNYINGPESQPASALADTLSGIQSNLKAPTALSAYTAKDMSTTDLPQYDIARTQENQSLNSTAQGNSDAMQRRFAAMGNLNSGAYIKASQVGDQQANEAKANAMAGINMQEAGARTSLQQNEANKEFQSGESTKQFNAGQSNQFQQFNANLGSENASKVSSLDLAYKSAQQQAADDQYQAAMNGYQAMHSGGLLGSGGFLGTGIGV